MLGYFEGWFLLVTSLALSLAAGQENLWRNWWGYDGISGPQFWGVMNPSWTVCSKGRNQSPINIEPDTLLFDPRLAPLDFHGDSLSGTLYNNGHDITLYIHNNSSAPGVNVTSGPLSYMYRVDQIKFHFGRDDTDGSEHGVAGKKFLVEMQIFAFNVDLYSNFSTAERQPRGLAAIAVFLQVSDNIHKEMKILEKAINSTIYKGDSTYVPRLRLRQVLPSTHHYITYEGSLTIPGCQETVTWVVFNRPVYISKTQLAALRLLRQDTIYNPVILMGGNIRPYQPLNQRSVRTNIDFSEKKCSMAQNMYYEVNEYLQDRDIR